MSATSTPPRPRAPRSRSTRCFHPLARPAASRGRSARDARSTASRWWHSPPPAGDGVPRQRHRAAAQRRVLHLRNAGGPARRRVAAGAAFLHHRRRRLRRNRAVAADGPGGRGHEPGRGGPQGHVAPVGARPRASLRSRLRPIDSAREPSAHTGVYLIETATRNVSSTTIRTALQAGRSIADLVPDVVERHIIRHGLYGAVDRLHGNT